MNIGDLLSVDSIVAGFKASSKKQAIQALARKIAVNAGVDDRLVFDKLLERERLGSTGVGKGVAIPHARIAGLPKITGLFAKLASPIDFDSVDERPVDLIFMLLAPEEAGADHLKALASVSRLLRDDQMCNKLRLTPDSNAIYAMLAEPSSAAA
tara:strand:+ start:392 stop:853 length:462 start_codon:yes stop_codon:yes gene_type:complete